MASATPFGLRHASASSRKPSGSRPSDADHQGKKAASAAGRVAGTSAALAPRSEEASSDEDIDALDPRREPAFRLRRLQNWFFLGLMYGFFYMSRYNFSAVQAAVAGQFGWSHSDYASILSAGLLTYSFAVFLNGPLADRIGGKRAIQHIVRPKEKGEHL